MSTATQTSASDILNGMNPKVREMILHECITTLENSAEGKRLESLIGKIQDQLSHEAGKDVDDLAGGLIHLYGEEMFKYGLAMGRDPWTVLNLPDSGCDY